VFVIERYSCASSPELHPAMKRSKVITTAINWLGKIVLFIISTPLSQRRNDRLFQIGLYLYFTNRVNEKNIILVTYSFVFI
jgi:hypothetical protein